MRRSTALRAYVAVVGTAILVHLVAPTAVVATLSDLVVSLTAAVGCAVGLRLHRPERPGSWRWVLVGLVSALLGSVIWAVLDVLGRDPTSARAFYLVAYGSAAVGVWTLVRHRSGHDAVDRVLASTLIAVAAVVMAWLFVVQPLERLGDTTESGRALLAVFPVLNVGLTVMLVRYLVGRRDAPRAYWIVAGGLASFIAADIITIAGLGSVGSHSPATLRLIAFGWIGMATLHPSVSDPMESADPEPYRLSRPELLAVLLGGVAGPISLLVRLDEATRIELVVIAVCSALLVALVVARLWRLLGVLAESTRRRNEHRFQALVENAGDVICVIDPSGDIVYVSPTAERVWGYTPAEMAERAFDMVEDADRRRVERQLGRWLAAPSDPVMRVGGRARHADGSWRQFEATFANRVDDPAVNGIVATLRDVTDRFDLEQRLWNQAYVDQLTDLPNRALLLERTGAALESCSSDGSRPVLLVIDIDDFKTVNDSLGPLRGDELLRIVADRLGSIGGDGASAARLVGDAFAILVPDGGDDASIEALAVRALDILHRPVMLAGRRMEPRVSVGLAVGAPDATADELLRDADAAMHVAKRQSRGSFRVFDPEMHAAAVRRLQLQMDLGSAIVNDQLWVAYQPVHEIRTGRMAGVEALLRWDHPVRGPVSPAEFIPLAEASGSIGALGEFVLRRACRDLAALRAARGADLSLSVNLSPAQLADPALSDTVASALADSGLPASRLMLEVTEGVFLESSHGVTAALNSLRALGVRLAIDDFGTGYCALGYLTKFRFDVVKIDRSFIEVLDMPGGDRRVTLGILELVASLEVPAVAEGIETAAQLDDLRAIGCEYGQGYHWSRPVPITELPDVDVATVPAVRHNGHDATWQSADELG